MELVYLWVEKYKNINNQGFNFSPRFDCDFDGENLTIEDLYKDKEYIDIFPDNINITAIVGENGSGKSSLCGEIFATIRQYELNNLDYSISYLLPKIKGDILTQKHLKPLNPLLKKNNQLKDIIKEGVKVTDQYIDDVKEKIKKIATEIKYETFEFIFLIKHEESYYSVTNIESITSLHRINSFNTFYELEENHEISLFAALGEFSTRENHKGGHFVDSKYSILPLQRAVLNNSNASEIQQNILNKINFKQKKITIDEKKIKGNVSFNNVKLGDLSFGEKFKILLFSQIYEKLCQNKNAIIFLDEVTLSFHPNWEKAFIQELITLFNDYNVHFIISSHSTFILSDIPKEHIIFLGQDREGNCQKISNTINITQTFGANIHTLLSHGFFMDGGLMGEFAKGKIEEIKKFYELVKFLEKKLHQKPYCYVKLIFIFKIKEFRHIQSIIGEPFLQTVIKNYLDELEIIFNGEKQFLKQEIKRLQDLESRL